MVVLEPERVTPDETSLEAYSEIRKQAELHLARLAAKNATRDDGNAMQTAIEKQAKALAGLEQIDSVSLDLSGDGAANIFGLYLADREFHAAVRKAAKEPWLEVIHEIASGNPSHET